MKEALKEWLELLVPMLLVAAIFAFILSPLWWPEVMGWSFVVPATLVLLVADHYRDRRAMRKLPHKVSLPNMGGQEDWD